MRLQPHQFVICLLPFACGCGTSSSATPIAREVTDDPIPGLISDAESVRAADYSILFVGNSHTMFHDLPKLTSRMIQFLRPGKTVYIHIVAVAFLEDTARSQTCRQEIETREWKHVVLQAQKISASGKVDYSRAEGIETARLAKARGASVVFFSEWGLRDKPGDGPRTEGIYRAMAGEAGVGVAPIGRAWDLALSRKSDLPLYEADGNHQTRLGAFLTACVLAGRLSGEGPAALAEFPDGETDGPTRKLLADAAAEALVGEGR